MSHGIRAGHKQIPTDQLRSPVCGQYSIQVLHKQSAETMIVPFGGLTFSRVLQEFGRLPVRELKLKSTCVSCNKNNKILESYKGF